MQLRLPRSVLYCPPNLSADVDYRGSTTDIELGDFLPTLTLPQLSMDSRFNTTKRLYALILRSETNQQGGSTCYYLCLNKVLTAEGLLTKGLELFPYHQPLKEGGYLWECYAQQQRIASGPDVSKTFKTHLISGSVLRIALQASIPQRSPPTSRGDSASNWRSRTSNSPPSTKPIATKPSSPTKPIATKPPPAVVAPLVAPGFLKEYIGRVSPQTLELPKYPSSSRRSPAERARKIVRSAQIPVPRN